MIKYPDLNEKKESSFLKKKRSHEVLQTSTEIISEEISLDDDFSKKNSEIPSKNISQNKESYFSKIQVGKDPFMDKREVEIKEVKTTTEWLILEQRVYLLKTYKRKNEGNDLAEITEVERRFSDFEWLYLELKLKYPGFIVPPLPDKNALSKININETNNEFLESRKRALVLFIQKLLKHNELRYSPELRKFLEETSHKFEITKANSEQKLNPSNKTIINTIYSYVTSFWQTKRVRESNREDQLLENEKKFLETQQQKLNEIVKSLHNLFSNKKEEKKTYGEMSTIFGSLEENEKLESAQSILHSLKEKTELISKIQDKKTKDFIENIEIPLNENSRYLGACIEIIDERKTLENDIFEMENALHDMKSKTSKEEDMNNLEKRLNSDIRRLDSLNKNFAEDLKNFKTEINNDINNLLKLYKEMQIKAANEMYDIWKPLKKENHQEKEKEEEKN